MVYLVSTVPAIWILEFQLMEDRIELSMATGRDVCLESDSIYTNGTSLVAIPGVSCSVKEFGVSGVSSPSGKGVGEKGASCGRQLFAQLESSETFVALMWFGRPIRRLDRLVVL